MTDERRSWRRISRGLSTLGFGVFLLLNTTGYLPWSFWLDAATFWPVILVAIGIRLIFEKSRAPALILLSPLLILATLGYAAWAGEPAYAAALAPIRIEREPDLEQWTLSGGLGFATLNLHAGEPGEGALVSGGISDDTGRTVSYTTSGRSARVRLGGNDRHRIVFHPIPRRRSSWDLTIPRDLPVSVDLGMGFTRGRMDLENVEVKRFDLEGGFNDVTVRLGAPSVSTRLVFEGAFNDIEIVVPEQTPVSVDTDGLLNLVDGRSRAGRLQGPGYRLSVDGAFNSFTVRSE